MQSSCGWAWGTSQELSFQPSPSKSNPRLHFRDGGRRPGPRQGSAACQPDLLAAPVLGSGDQIGGKDAVAAEQFLRDPCNGRRSEHPDRRTTLVPRRMHQARIVHHVVGMQVAEEQMRDFGRLAAGLHEPVEHPAAAVEQDAVGSGLDQVSG